VKRHDDTAVLAVFILLGIILIVWVLLLEVIGWFKLRR